MIIYTSDCRCAECAESCEHYKKGQCDPGESKVIVICDHCDKVIPSGDYCLEYEDKHFCDDECLGMYLDDKGIVKQVVSETD